MQQDFLEFKDNVEHLLDICSALEEQMEELNKANEELRKEIIRSHAEFEEIRKKYGYLQTAHALSGETENKEQARRKLTSLIQLVDKAIDKLAE